jgi:acylphosphatase
MDKLVWLKVKGRVQGVFYRQSTRQEARQLGLKGWVRNMADGSVEALIQGPEPAVDTLVQWCRRGPDSAIVDTVDVKCVQAESQGEHNLSEYDFKFNEKFEIR